jgi:thioredoxin-related protein
MKRKTLFLLLLFSSVAFSSDNWFSNFDEAKRAAEKSNKNVMLYFSGSDWCRPCILLKKKVFETEEFDKFAKENLILAMFDFPIKDKNKPSAEQIEHNEKIAELYNPDGNFPHIVLVTSKGKKIREFSGYGNESPADYIAKLKKALADY